MFQFLNCYFKIDDQRMTLNMRFPSIMVMTKPNSS